MPSNKALRKKGGEVGGVGDGVGVGVGVVLPPPSPLVSSGGQPDMPKVSA